MSATTIASLIVSLEANVARFSTDMQQAAGVVQSTKVRGRLATRASSKCKTSSYTPPGWGR